MNETNEMYEKFCLEMDMAGLLQQKKSLATDLSRFPKNNPNRVYYKMICTEIEKRKVGTTCG